MAKFDGVPAPAVRRLSLYLRQLEAFRDTNLHTVSSKQLGEALRITDAQVRKDLAYFGQFGQAGIGYDVEELIAKVRNILGTDRTWNVVLVGAGNLGRALLAYRGFRKKGFRIAAVFDGDPAKQNRPASADSDLDVHALEDLPTTVAEQDIHLAVIAVPAQEAQAVADRLVAAGIKGIMNMAPAALHVPQDVAVIGLDLAVHLEQLSFQVGAAAARGNNNHDMQSL